ncbi:hypothetical protein GF361_04745 [Candidatus Woesearchaeota archaeon]|nr:hypothetical protein [Candidatus Woesearchaeota archaeon]
MFFEIFYQKQAKSTLLSCARSSLTPILLAKKNAHKIFVWPCHRCYALNDIDGTDGLDLHNKVDNASKT